MNTQDLLQKYKESTNVKAIAETIQKKKQLRLKGIAGSYDALLVASTFKAIGGVHLIVLHDFEEASYFENDLSNFSVRGTYSVSILL